MVIHASPHSPSNGRIASWMLARFAYLYVRDWICPSVSLVMRGRRDCNWMRAAARLAGCSLTGGLLLRADQHILNPRHILMRGQAPEQDRLAVHEDDGGGADQLTDLPLIPGGGGGPHLGAALGDLPGVEQVGGDAGGLPALGLGPARGGLGSHDRTVISSGTALRPSYISGWQATLLLRSWYHAPLRCRYTR